VIKALTIRQPWAFAILNLGKDVENRSWRTRHRGPLLIHAAARSARNPRRMLSEYMKRPLAAAECGMQPWAMQILETNVAQTPGARLIVEA